MLFNIEQDTGYLISGYVVPDGFAEQPLIRVMDGKETVFEGPCNVVREPFLVSGRHETGLVGFELTQDHLPPPEECTDLHIMEARTNFLLYRRFRREQHVQHRVFRLETSFVPFFRMDRSVLPYFQYGDIGLEHQGVETVHQMFLVPNAVSVYLSGRVQVRQFEGLLSEQYKSVVSLHEPIYGMLLRMLALQNAKKQNLKVLSQRELAVFAEAIELSAEIDIKDPASILAGVRRASREQLQPFISPVTRQLASSDPQAKLDAHSVTAALDMLSQFAMVGLSSDTGELPNYLAEIADVSAQSIHTPTVFGELVKVAEQLKANSTVENLLEKDLILHHYVQQSVEAETPSPQAGHG